MEFWENEYSPYSQMSYYSRTTFVQLSQKVEKVSY